MIIIISTILENRRRHHWTIISYFIYYNRKTAYRFCSNNIRYKALGSVESLQGGVTNDMRARDSNRQLSYLCTAGMKQECELRPELVSFWFIKCFTASVLRIIHGRVIYECWNSIFRLSKIQRKICAQPVDLFIWTSLKQAVLYSSWVMLMLLPRDKQPHL